MLRKFLLALVFAGYGVEVSSARLLSLRNVGLHLLLVLCQVEEPR